MIPGEPYRAKLLSSLTVAVSYVTTLPHAYDSFRVLRLVLHSDEQYVPNSQFMLEIMSLGYLAGCTSNEDMSSKTPQFVLRNGSYFVPDILFEFLK